MEPVEARKLTLARIRDAEKRIAESRKATPVLSLFHHGSGWGMAVGLLATVGGLVLGLLGPAAGDMRTGGTYLGVAVAGVLGMLLFWQTYRRSQRAEESVNREVQKDEELIHRLKASLSALEPPLPAITTPESRELAEGRLRDAQRRIKEKRKAQPVLTSFASGSWLALAISMLVALVGLVQVFMGFNDSAAPASWVGIALTAFGFGGLLLFWQTGNRSERAEQSIQHAIEKDEELILRLHTALHASSASPTSELPRSQPTPQVLELQVRD